MVRRAGPEEDGGVNFFPPFKSTNCKSSTANSDTLNLEKLEESGVQFALIHSHESINLLPVVVGHQDLAHSAIPGS